MSSSEFDWTSVGVLLLAGTITSCAVAKMIPVDIKTSTTVQHLDGQVEHHETHIATTADKLPAALVQVGSELADVTARLVKELTDVPPPGTIVLSDLGPAFTQFQGNPDTDFVMSAKDQAGNPVSFQYVRLGVPSYDDFFKQAQVIYALCHQANHTVRRLVRLSTDLLARPIDVGAGLNEAVGEALALEGRSDVNTGLLARLKTTRTLGTAVAALPSQFVAQTEHLVATGQALITNAPSSLTNPKVVAHLDLVKEGLTDSVKVIGASAGELKELGKSLAGFASREAPALN